MISALELFEIAEQEGIVVEWRNLGDCFLGIYLFDCELTKAYISLNKSIINNTRLTKCVLAHELGHHFCTAGQRVVAATATQLIRLAKHEHLANDWAVDKLVPAVEFLELIQKQYAFEEIVDYFDVVPEMVIHRAKRIYENGLTLSVLRQICRNDVFRLMG